MTDLRVSQTVRESVINPYSTLRVSQQVRQTIVNPLIPLHVSQIVRLTLIAKPVPETFYCWARQTNYPTVMAVTGAIVVSPAS